MIKVTDKGFWVETYLKQQLDTVDYNMKNDWDFVWIITGNGETRVGKTMLAQQCGYYIAHKRGTPFTDENMVFSGKELRKKAHQFPPNSVFVFDESRSELDSKKALSTFSKDMLDFLAECGRYNHFIILVLPDYFELNKSIAVTRSAALINCFKKGVTVKDSDGNDVTQFVRGFFNFYGKKQKKKLYLFGKKENDYSVEKPIFSGEFRNHWVIDFEKYEGKKMEFITRTGNQPNKWEKRFITLLKVCLSDKSMVTIANEMTAKGCELSTQTLYDNIHRFDAKMGVS